MIAGIKMTEAQARKALPKHGCTFDEFAYMVGSTDLATKMRKAGWIMPRIQKPMLFDAGDIALCWGRVLNGEAPLSK